MGLRVAVHAGDKVVQVVADDEQHIRVVKDEQATRKGILDAFKEHLLDNEAVDEDSIVVFHYSGHGGKQKDVSPDTDEVDGPGMDDLGAVGTADQRQLQFFNLAFRSSRYPDCIDGISADRLIMPHGRID